MTKKYFTGYNNGRLLCVLLLLPGMVARAQWTRDYLKAADRYYARADYASAATYYEKYLGGKRTVAAGSDPYLVTARASAGSKPASHVAVTYQLAESYRQLTDVAKATPLYKQVSEADAAGYPLALFYYAAGERALGHYAAAEQAFRLFLQSSGNTAKIPEAKRELANLQFIQQQLAGKDTAGYTIVPLAAGKNGASYAPAQLNAGTLLFTATWPEGSTNHINRIYQAGYTPGALTQPMPVELPAADTHQGAAVVSEDGSTLYYTAWNTGKGKKEAAVYAAKRTGNAWGKPVLLDSLMNKPGTNTQQPMPLPGGKYLLFVSDRPGGLGGYDIWYAELNSLGHVAAVKNAGAVLNTPGNEQAPYYHAPSGKLVFATDGRTGMGGYDLFYSTGSIASWSTPVNLGYPVNSVKDDIYFLSMGKGDNPAEEAVFSSDRSAACCLELMAIHKVPAPPAPEKTTVVVIPETPADTTSPVPVFTSRVLENVYYALNSAELQQVSFITLNQLADTLLAYPSLEVEIGGHTDSTGTATYNKLLSQRRADNVAAYLVSRGVDKKRVTAKGYGAEVPLAPNTKPDGADNPEGREKNRRTELKIIKQ